MYIKESYVVNLVSTSLMQLTDTTSDGINLDYQHKLIDAEDNILLYTYLIQRP